MKRSSNCRINSTYCELGLKDLFLFEGLFKLDFLNNAVRYKVASIARSFIETRIFVTFSMYRSVDDWLRSGLRGWVCVGARHAPAVGRTRGDEGIKIARGRVEPLFH